MDDEDEMRLPDFRLGQDLATYLAQIRKVVFSKSRHQHVTLVLGNPSCDLDSFVCAFTLSYFYNARPNPTKHHKHPIYVPVLNLPFVDKGDLWRLRPEFGVAFRGAFDGLTPESTNDYSSKNADDHRQREQKLLERMITVHELVNNSDTIPSLRHAFQPSEKLDNTKQHEKVDTILVDHNAPAVENINEDDLAARFNLVGCIDHHVEENAVPQNVQPRIVRLGIGSCMSLVMEHLRKLNLWTAQSDDRRELGIQQIARLALTPIVIDTWDLKAPGDRVSDLDREQVTFLDAQTGSGFNREDLFQQATTAKNESPNLLRMDEIFARDYKSYAEQFEKDTILNIGIGSTVKDFEWMSEHAGGSEKLVDDIIKYSRQGVKLLEIFGLLTRSGDRKQVAMFAFGKQGQKAIEIFEQKAKELQLERWSDDKDLIKYFDEKIGQDRWKVWWMNDTSKSRKQVAPLIRDALHQAHDAREDSQSKSHF